MEKKLTIFNYDDDKFKEIIAISNNYYDVVRLIFNDELLDKSRILNRSHTYKNDLLKKIEKLGLDTSHFKEYTTKKVDLDKKLVEDKKINSDYLKKLLYKEGLKEEKCEKCGIGDSWQGLPIVHQLDHINGKREDNRIENLRILCPICHAQTDTYCIGLKQVNINGYK